MDNLIPFIIGGISGILMLSISGAIAYRRYSRVREQLISDIDKAERELRDDINRIGMEELQQTKSGKELVRLHLEHELYSLRLRNEALMKNLKSAERSLAVSELLQAIVFHKVTIDTLRKQMTDPSISPSEKYKLRNKIEQSENELENLEKKLLAEGR